MRPAGRSASLAPGGRLRHRRLVDGALRRRAGSCRARSRGAATGARPRRSRWRRGGGGPRRARHRAASSIRRAGAARARRAGAGALLVFDGTRGKPAAARTAAVRGLVVHGAAVAVGHLAVAKLVAAVGWSPRRRRRPCPPPRRPTSSSPPSAVAPRARLNRGSTRGRVAPARAAVTRRRRPATRPARVRRTLGIWSSTSTDHQVEHGAVVVVDEGRRQRVHAKPLARPARGTARAPLGSAASASAPSRAS